MNIISVKLAVGRVFGLKLALPGSIGKFVVGIEILINLSFFSLDPLPNGCHRTRSPPTSLPLTCITGTAADQPTYHPHSNHLPPTTTHNNNNNNNNNNINNNNNKPRGSDPNHCSIANCICRLTPRKPDFGGLAAGGGGLEAVTYHGNIRDVKPGLLAVAQPPTSAHESCMTNSKGSRDGSASPATNGSTGSGSMLEGEYFRGFSAHV